MNNHGGLHPPELTLHMIEGIVGSWRKRFAQHTRSNYTKCLRRFLRWIVLNASANPTLPDVVPKIHQPQPRLTIATDAERRQLLEAATPALRFFILLCSELGLRHRTAAHITPRNYNPHLRAITFKTKGDVQQTLPVTAAIAEVFAALPSTAHPDTPVVNLLRSSNPASHTPGKNPRFTKQWTKLKQQLGIRADLRIHDLRRTVAEDVWSATHDIRAVQAQLGHRSPITTARYLADRIDLQDLQPVLQKVQQLRALREAQPTHPMNATGACDRCPGPHYCQPENRLCQRKEHDA